MSVVEIACSLVVLALLTMRYRYDVKPWRCLCRLGAIAVAVWVAEDVAMHLYSVRDYSSGPWTLYADRVPLLAVLCGAVLVETAWTLARHLRGSERCCVVWLAAGIVMLDASIVEPIGVAAGLWEWRIPGMLGVPSVAYLGYAAFAAVALGVLESHRRRGRQAYWDFAIVPAAPLVAHLVVISTSSLGLHRLGASGAGWIAVVVAAAAGTSLLRLGYVSGVRSRVAPRVLFERTPGAVLLMALLAAHGSSYSGRFVAWAVVIVASYLAAVPWHELRTEPGRAQERRAQQEYPYFAR